MGTRGRWIADFGLRIGGRPAAGRRPCAVPPPACRGRSAQNEPNFPAGPNGTESGDSRVDRAKQTQFSPERRNGQVLCGKRVMANGVCQEAWRNKANLRAGSKGQRPAGPVVQTNPICPAMPGGTGLGGQVDRAKQTQFPARRVGWTRSLSCETKPISTCRQYGYNGPGSPGVL